MFETLGNFLRNPLSVFGVSRNLYSTSSVLLEKQPVYCDVSYGMLMNVYLQSPYLRIVIDRLAEMFSNAEVQVLDRDGNVVENHPVVKLLQQPTPLETFEQWSMRYSILQDVHSNSFIYKLSGLSSVLPAALWNMEPWDLKIIPTGKIFGQSKIEDIITEYEKSTSKEKFKPGDVLTISHGISEDYLFAKSKIYSLQKNISNSNAALETRNVLMQDRGAFGFLSFVTKDGDGGTPLGNKERERIEKEWMNSYGIGNQANGKRKRPFNITTSDAKWLPMSFPAKDLLLFEEVEEDLGAIMGAYGLRRDCLPSVKGATFENQMQAEKSTYESCIIPKADRLTRALTTGLQKFFKDGERLNFDYNWLPCMQKDKEKEASVLQKKTQSIQSLVQANIINPAQAQALVKQITDLQIDDTLSSNNSILGKLIELSPLVANNFIGNITINEVREILGLTAITGGEALAKVSTANPNQQPASNA